MRCYNFKNIRKSEKGLKNYRFTLIFTLLGIIFVFSACGPKFAKGNPYYYTLQQLTDSYDQKDIQLYIIDPFEEKRLLMAKLCF